MALQHGDPGARLHAQLGVEVGQRLVHQEHPRLPDDDTPHRNPLPLISLIEEATGATDTSRCFV
jgi:hypothetical protein